MIRDLPRLELRAGFDRTIAFSGGGSVRHLVVDLSAAADASDRPPPALDLALAFDASGSMAGEKIEAARAAAAAVAESLTGRDRLSLVAFSGEARTVLDPIPMTADGRRAALAAIARLVEGGNTALFDGWLLAAEHAAAGREARPGASRRVLLLSDGQANAGLTDPAEIAGHAAALMARGVATSCVGIGADYDEGLLCGLAEAGGGRLHDGAHAGDIGALVLGDLREGLAALAGRVTLSLTLPAGFRAEAVGPWSVSLRAGGLVATVGDLLAGQTKRVVFRVFCPAGEAGGEARIAVAASGVGADGAPLGAGPETAALRFAAAPANDAQPRDPARARAVFDAWRAEVMQRLAAMNRAGELHAAEHFAQAQLRFIERYAEGVPAAREALRELALIARRAGEAWAPRDRLEVNACSAMLARSETDRLDRPRGPLAALFR